MHTYIHTCIHTCMHTCIHACMHAYIHTYVRTSSQFFENQPNKICSHLSEKASKDTFLRSPKSSKIIVTKEKDRGEGKEKKKKKNNGFTLVFIMATLEIVFGLKKLFGANGPFGDNVLKNPARHTYIIYLIWQVRKIQATN